MIKKGIICALLVLLAGCKQQNKIKLPETWSTENISIAHAKGFRIEKSGNDITLIKISSPWPDAEAAFTYALIPKDKMASITLNKDEYDAIVSIPVERIVVTSTTHIPALESLGVLDRLVGFPDTKYISSPRARERIEAESIKELGSNESINTEMTIALNPEVIVGFAINGQNKTYETLQKSHIPVVYNGDWTEETPLGKAEWIKFFAPFFQLEKKADSLFAQIETSYENSKALATKASKRPTVLSGAMYKDVWYLPGGGSWAAQFLKDANADYLWGATTETGSLSLSWENVLETAQHADLWVSPSQFTSYKNMSESSLHYQQFSSFQNKNIYTFSKTVGATGGLLFYELAPQRPDLILNDLIHIFHPELLPDHQPYFFKPLD